MKEFTYPNVYAMSFANCGASYVADPGAEGAAAGGEGAGAAAAASAAPAGTEGAAASQAGTGSEPAAWAPLDLEYKGQKVAVKTREEAIALMQQGHDYTQKTQSAAKAKQEALKIKQEYMSRLERTTALLAELEAKRNKAAEGEGGEEAAGESQQAAAPANDKLQKLEQELAEMRDEKNAEAWVKLTAPILQKFPDVPEGELAVAFEAAVSRGEVENTMEGLQEVAEQMNGHYSGELNKRLEKQLSEKDSPLVKTHNDKVISAFLNDANNPKLQEFTQKVIADYVAGKLKLKNAAGDTGKGAGTGSGKKERTIAEIAASHRAAFRED